MASPSSVLQPLHDLYPPLHLLPHTSNSSLHVCNQERAPLNPPVISVHDITRSFPLFPTLLQVLPVAIVSSLQVLQSGGRAYANGNDNNNHTNNASHDEDERKNNSVNATCHALTYSPSTRTRATLCPSTPVQEIGYLAVSAFGKS
jgi:hypothetical protein